jgi:hypothetical protein
MDMSAVSLLAAVAQSQSQAASPTEKSHSNQLLTSRANLTIPASSIVDALLANSSTLIHSSQSSPSVLSSSIAASAAAAVFAAQVAAAKGNHSPSNSTENSSPKSISLPNAQRTPSRSASMPAPRTESEIPSSKGQKNGVAPGDKLKKRLARKAELARASRRRKKAYVNDLEEKVAILTKNVEDLQRANVLGIPFSPAPPVNLKFSGKNKGQLDESDSEMSESEEEDAENVKSAAEDNDFNDSPFDDNLERAIKSSFNADTRRFALIGRQFNLNSLISALKKIYTSLGPSFSITYIDEEGDKILISTTAELHEAYRLNNFHNNSNGNNEGNGFGANTNNLLKIFIEEAASSTPNSIKLKKRRKAEENAFIEQKLTHNPPKKSKSNSPLSPPKKLADNPANTAENYSIILELVDKPGSVSRATLSIPISTTFSSFRANFADLTKLPNLHEFIYHFNGSIIDPGAEAELMHSTVGEGQTLQLLHGSIVADSVHQQQKWLSAAVENGQGHQGSNSSGAETVANGRAEENKSAAVDALTAFASVADNA